MSNISFISRQHYHASAIAPGMDMWVAKLIAGIVLFILSLSFGLSPLFCLRRYIGNPSSGKAKAALGFASCVAAGVFLAVCLLDLLPDVQQSLTAGLTELDIHISFPLAELIMAVGLFFILTVELSVSMCSPDFTELMHSHGASGHGHSHSQTPRPQQDLTFPISNVSNYRSITGASALDDSDNDIATSLGRSPLLSYGSGTNSLLKQASHLKTIHTRRRHRSSECERTPLFASNPPLLETEGNSINDDRPTLTRTPSVHSLPPMHIGRPLREEMHEAGLSMFDRPFRAIILLVALSIHSLFEGLSIGAAQSNDIVIQLALALAIHKPLESLGVCLSLIRSSTSQSFVVKMVVLFSITCPLGVGIGATVLGFLTNGVSDLVTGILQGLAGGSFLYVVFIEVLPHEFVDVLEKPEAPLQPVSSAELGGHVSMTFNIAREAKRIRTLKMFKLLGLLLGFTLITLTKLLLPEADEVQHPC